MGRVCQKFDFFFKKRPLINTLMYIFRIIFFSRSIAISISICLTICHTISESVFSQKHPRLVTSNSVTKVVLLFQTQSNIIVRMQVIEHFLDEQEEDVVFVMDQCMDSSTELFAFLQREAKDAFLRKILGQEAKHFNFFEMLPNLFEEQVLPGKGLWKVKSIGYTANQNGSYDLEFHTIINGCPEVVTVIQS